MIRKPHRSSALRAIGLALAGMLAAAGVWSTRARAATQTSPRYEVYAVRFAHVPFALSSLVAGAERGPMVDIAFTVWPIKDVATGRIILFDSGFYRDKFIASWHPQDFVKPSDAVASAMDIAPADVTDVIISHIHWDHADGADLFPKATIWLQKDEYDYYIGPNGEVPHRTIDPLDAKMLSDLHAAGRVKFINGDNQEVFPGIRAYLGGKHTYASQYLSVPTRSGTVVLASDNAYLFQNLDNHVAIAQTLDATSNLAAQSRMLQLAASPRLVIPGHDPAVFDRFPQVKPNVVRID